MTRKSFLALVAGSAAAQTQRGIYRDYSRCLPDYLASLAKRSYTVRNQELSKLAIPAAIAARQAWARKTFWQLVGGEPEKTPLKPRSLGSFAREGYRLEKLIYESQPNFHVSANLYLPSTGQPPYPGVLFQMGHALNGKAYPLYQRCCQGLARLGFVVLAFDPMGQGERIYYPGNAPGVTRLSSADEEHTLPGRQMLLNGIGSTRLQTWDAVRSLDYLAGHPMVDPKRLASTGQSGGATNTMLLAAVDSRLACAAIACANTENVAAEPFLSPGSTDDAEQNFPGGGPLGFDRWDLLYPFAPKPLLVALSERDFFGTYSPNYVRNGIEEYDKLRRVYQTMGQGSKIEWYSNPLPHGLTYEMRLSIYKWFRRWLQPDQPPVAQEPPTSPEPDATLFVTESGNVVRPFEGETPFSLNRKFSPIRKSTPLAELLNLDQPPGSPAVTLKRTEYRSTTVEAIEVPSAPGVWVPGYLFQSKQKTQGPLIIIVEPNGRALWHEDELYDQLAQKGYAVCAADLRGIGDLTPEFARGSSRHARGHNSEEHYGWAGLTFGKPLASQRVTDILALVRGLHARPDLSQRPVRLAARGGVTVPALFAAALEPRVERTYLSGPLLSFRSVVDSENYSVPMGNFVPGFLAHTDLPAIAASISAGKLVIAGAVNATGQAVTIDEVKRLYPQAEVRAMEPWSAVE